MTICLKTKQNVTEINETGCISQIAQTKCQYSKYMKWLQPNEKWTRINPKRNIND